MPLSHTQWDEVTLSTAYEAGDYQQALELIDSAALPALEGNSDDPELAGVALIVANVYRDLAKYSAAEPYYLQALAGLAAAGKDRPAYARGLMELALFYEKLERDEQAMELTATARRIYESANEPDPVCHARCLQDLAGNLDSRFRRREATSLLREARQILEAARATPGDIADQLLEEAQVLCRVEGCLVAISKAREALSLRLKYSGASHVATAYAQYVLADFLLTLCQHDEAEQLLNSARPCFGKILGTEHPRYASVLELLALAKAAQGDQREAETLARHSLDITSTTMGDRHLWTADSHRTLAQVFHTASRLTAAEECYESALEIARGRFDDQHPFTAGLLIELAELRAASGRRREATDMTQAALASLEAYGDDVLYERAWASLTLAQMAFEGGRMKEAEEMARRANDRSAQLGEDPLLCVPILLLRSELEARRGRMAPARDLLSKAELAMAGLPLHHPLRNQSRFARAGMSRMRGEPAQAIALARESVRHAERTPYLAGVLCFLAEQQQQSGELSEAESSYERALAIQQGLRDSEHLEQATTLRGLAKLRLVRGNLQAAEVRFRKAWEIRKNALGEHHPATAESLADLASLAHQVGDLLAAGTMYQQANEIRTECLGKSHPETVMGLHGLATVVWDRGELSAAAQILEQALQPLEEGQPERESLRHTLALVYHSRGEIGKAVEELGRVLAVYESVMDGDHDGLVPVLTDLARFHAELGDHMAARQMLKRIRSIHAHSPVPQPVIEAMDLMLLSDSHRFLYDLDRAGELADQALELARRHMPRDDPALLQFLIHSAANCRVRRLFSRSGHLLDETEEMVRRFGGERHPYMVGLWTERARLEFARGRAARAASLLARGADLAAVSLGEDHLDHANARQMLGLHLESQRDHVGADAQLHRCMAITRRTLGADHPAVALGHISLALVFQKRGDLSAAAAECNKALQLIRSSEYPLDAVHANALHTLAVIRRMEGKLIEAEEHFKKVVEIDRETAGEEGDTHLDTQRELALVEAGRGSSSSALERLCRAMAAQDKLVSAYSCLPPDKVRDDLLTAPWQLVEQILTLSLQLPHAAATAMDIVLRWNAVAPVELAIFDRSTLARRNPADAEAIHRWFDLSLQIAGRLINGPGQANLQTHHDLLGRWGEECRRLEQELAGRTPSLARLLAWRSVNTDALRSALPERVTFVEMVRYRPRDFSEMCAGRDGLRPARYAAFVLDGQNVVMIDAGPADVLEHRGGGAALRNALAPHIDGSRPLLVGHGGLRPAAWKTLANNVHAVRAGRELISPLLAQPSASWLARVRGWLGI